MATLDTEESRPEMAAHSTPGPGAELGASRHGAQQRFDVRSLRCRGRYYCILSRTSLSQCEEDLITIRSDNIRRLNISSSGMSNEQEISFRARGSHRRANIPQLKAERLRPVLTPEYLGSRASSLRVGEQDIGIGRKERAFVCQVLTGL